jgi:hypothetical protein
MPYDQSRDQYYWGYSPERDGTGFIPGKASPKLSDAFRVLKTHVKDPINTRVQIVVVGKMYGKQLKGQSISGASGTVTFGSLEATATSAGLTGQAVQRGGGGFSTEQKIHALLGLKEIPEKITGIYFRILD